jgi:hypothetical protein
MRKILFLLILLAASRLEAQPTHANNAHGGAASTSTVSAAADAHTTGNTIVLTVTWIYTDVAVSSVTDTAGNTYTCAAELGPVSQYLTQICWSVGITGHASNVVSVNFSGGNFVWAEVMVDEFTGLGAVEAGNYAATGTVSSTNTLTFSTTATNTLMYVSGMWQTPMTGTTWNNSFSTIAVTSRLTSGYQVFGSVQASSTTTFTADANDATIVQGIPFTISEGEEEESTRRSLSSTGVGK